MWSTYGWDFGGVKPPALPAIGLSHVFAGPTALPLRPGAVAVAILLLLIVIGAGAAQTRQHDNENAATWRGDEVYYSGSLLWC